MTIKEVKEEFKNEYEEIEVFTANTHGRYYPKRFHTDNCSGTEDYSDESEVGLYELMDEEDYGNTIMANVNDHADFGAWYGNQKAKVLCIMLADCENE